MTSPLTKAQQVWVFDRQHGATAKIRGIRRYTRLPIRLKVFSIDADLPAIIDDGRDFLPDHVTADLVLDYLGHPDLSDDLARLCENGSVPVIASGRRGQPRTGVWHPATCCALARNEALGHYGRCFGAPEFDLQVDQGRIGRLDVRRGAPCGATWPAAAQIIGRELDRALVDIGIEVQYRCAADPSAWDPISGKSPVHIAGDMHKAALVNALAAAQGADSCPN